MNMTTALGAGAENARKISFISEVHEKFCCAYAPYFWQAVQIRYPEYAVYNKNLYALFGGTD